MLALSSKSGWIRKIYQEKLKPIQSRRKVKMINSFDFGRKKSSLTRCLVILNDFHVTEKEINSINSELWISKMYLK